MLKLPAWKFLKAESSTADAIGEQLGLLDRAYADADAELSRLGSHRPALLLDTTATADAKLATLDAEMAAARRVMEATGARRDRGTVRPRLPRPPRRCGEGPRRRFAAARGLRS